jgi:hypothetical protein
MIHSPTNENAPAASRGMKDRTPRSYTAPSTDATIIPGVALVLVARGGRP